MDVPTSYLIIVLSVLNIGFATRVFILKVAVDNDVNPDPLAYQRLVQSRPVPSDKLPIVNLIENPNPMFDPPSTELNHHKLRKMLGTDFDPEYMDIGRSVMVLQPNRTISVKTKDGRPKGRKPSYVKDFGKPVRYGSQVRIPGLNLKRLTNRNVKKYMWTYTHCPVVFAWKDLGIRFWPRWIKEGVCYNGRSCSIPSGMSCRPKGSDKKTVLRWYCTLNEKKQIRNCEWLKIQYPILTECTCSC